MLKFNNNKILFVAVLIVAIIIIIFAIALSSNANNSVFNKNISADEKCENGSIAENCLNE